MKKIVISLILLLSSIHAVDLKKCDKCSISKEYVKCSYYVEIKGNLSKQESCLIFAQSMFENNSPGRASWYYLVGGDLDKALEAGKKALKVKEYFALEQLAEIFIIKKDLKNAKKYADLFKKRVPKGAIFIDKHFEILQRVYGDKFDIKIAKGVL